MKWGYWLFIVVWLTSFSSVHAEAEPPVIGVVDTQKIIHDSAAGKSIEIQYDTARQSFSDRVAKLENDLDMREQELNRQRTVLTQDAFNQQRQALESHAAEIQKTIEQQSQANQTAFNDAFAQLANSIKDIVAAVAKEKNLTIVLSQEQTVYLGQGAIDISDMVLNRLDSKLPSVTVATQHVDLPQPEAAQTGPAMKPTKP